MANWGLPILASLYTDFLNILKDRDDDCAKMFDGVTASNLPVNTIRWSSANNLWERWNGSAWSVLTNKFLTNVDTVDGYHAEAATTLTGNRIVTRDVNGRIHAQYLNVSAPDTTSVATKMMVEVTNDNLTRWQTPAQFLINNRANIKSQYEANSNTNAFTDAEKTKLAGLNGSSEGSGVFCGRATGTNNTMISGSPTVINWPVSGSSTVVTVTHNLGHTNYIVTANAFGPLVGQQTQVSVGAMTSTSFTLVGPDASLGFTANFTLINFN